MAEKFDPYYKWLGIPPKDQPPSHYRLLGLEVFESDPEVIDRAANRLMDYLHSITDGAHLAQSQALLNEIAAARLCLLDEKQKTRYDERLRAEGAMKGGKARDDEDGDDSSDRGTRIVRGKRSRTVAPPPAPVLAPPLAAPPVQRRTDGGHERRVHAKKPWGLIIGLGACVVLLAGGAAYVLVLKPAPQKTTVASAKQGPSAASRPKEQKDQKDAKTWEPPPFTDWLKSPPPDPADQGKTAEAAKTGESAKAVEPAKTAEPPMPAAKQGPAGPPRPETAQLFESAKEAVKKKNVKEALALVEKYLSDPAAPDAAIAGKWLKVLKCILSDDFMLREMEHVTDADLLKAETRALDFTLVPELDEMFMDAMRRNIPEAKRRRGLAGNGKAKEKMPPDAKVPGPDAKAPPAKAAESGPVPDPVTKPAEFLASQGLTRRNSHWSLPEGAAIAALAEIPAFEMKYKDAASKTADDLKTLNRNRARLSAALQQAEKAKSQGRKPPPQVVEFVNEWGQKIGDKLALGNNAELRNTLMGRIVPRNDLLLAMLKAQKLLAPLDEKYQELGRDPRVAEALSKLPGEKVGPSLTLGQARANFSLIEARVLGDETPMTLYGPETRLSVLINEVPFEVAYLPSQDFNMIPEAIVAKLGITIPPDAVKSTITTSNKRQVAARQIEIASVRIGKHVLKNVKFLATAPEGADMGTGLESRAFAGYRTETDYDNFVFKIRPEDAPEPKTEKKKAAR